MKFILPKDPVFINSLAELLYDIRAKTGGDFGVVKYIQFNLDKNPYPKDCLEYLSKNNIANVTFGRDNNFVSVVLYNHHYLGDIIGQVYELKQFDFLEEAYKHIVKKSVIYDPASGVGLINGKEFSFANKRNKFNKRNKRLFDALFLADIDGVDRQSLKKILRQGEKSGTQSAYEISGAFTNLRKILGVKSDILKLQDSGKLAIYSRFRPDRIMIKILLGEKSRKIF